MTEIDAQSRQSLLGSRYFDVRALTEELASPLSAEDQTIQSMPDVSPTKWHRGHTSWFFETFLLEPGLSDYVAFHPAFAYIFNSYYEALGARHPRAERGVISRPGAEEVGAYRRHVDQAMAQFLSTDLDPRSLDLVELGLNHEQQHQELLLMDIKHVLSSNPLLPTYRPGLGNRPGVARKTEWIEHGGGRVQIGHRANGFGFDNEFPVHEVELPAFALADQPVTCADWLAFIEDGGYHKPELWLSDGWALVNQLGWEAPLYWSRSGSGGGGGSQGHPSGWRIFTLGGERPVDPTESVCHVSYHEADAFAHWTGDRLPTESEWEAVAVNGPGRSNLLDLEILHPTWSGASAPGFLGGVWEWTSSAYCAYPGFRTAPGVVGEYNGKFMVNQYVLRGGSCITPADHVRATYRNFFPAAARWAFSGLRLARDL